MHAALHQKYLVIRKLLADDSADKIAARHEVGVHISEIRRCETRYGKSAIAQLAAALKCDLASLHRHASVAERWSARQMLALLRLAGARGRSLSWSHWVVLASIDSCEARTALIRQALHRPLSARRLAELARALNDPAFRLQQARATLTKLVRETQRFAAAQTELGLVLANLGGVADARALLEQALDAQEGAIAAARSRRELLRAAHFRLAAPTAMQLDQRVAVRGERT